MNILVFVFLALAVISSQFSIASSSVGIGGLIILTLFSLLTDKNTDKPEKNLLILFGIFIAAQVLSSMLCNSPAESFNHIYRKISIYIIFFAVIIFFNSAEQIKRFLIVFFIFSALVSVIESVRFFIDYIPHPSKPLAEYRLEYYGYPVTNGQIKMMILFLMIPFLLVKKNYIINKFYIALLSLPVLFTFYLTNARNALLGLFAGLIIIGALKSRKFLIGLLTVTALFIMFAPDNVKSRMLSIADLNHPSNKSRFIMWDTGMKILKDFPVTGIGDVDVKKVYSLYKTPEIHGEGSHMHNNVMQILINFGFIGFLAWFMLMLYLFINQLKVFFKTRGNEFLNILAMISVVSMIAMQITGLTEWNFGDAEFAAVFWFNLGLAFTAWKLFTRNGAVND